jgi:large subunit ribosomal protein L32e
MIKRERTRFTVPNFGAKNRKRVKDRWRKQRGIDNKRRVKKKNRGPVPKIGYKNSDIVRFSRPDGSFEALVHNSKELISVLSMPGYVARVAHGISVRKRLELQKIADEKKIRILNRVKI